MVSSELVPDALEDSSGNLVVVTLSIVAMVAFQVKCASQGCSSG